MPKTKQMISYHQDAVTYNEGMAQAAETLLEKVTDPTVKQWLTSIGSQHRYHEKKHSTTLQRLKNTRKRRRTSQEQKAVFVAAKNQREKEKTLMDEQAEFAAEQAKRESVERPVDAAPVQAHDTTGDIPTDAQPVDAAVETQEN